MDDVEHSTFRRFDDAAIDVDGEVYQFGQRVRPRPRQVVCLRGEPDGVDPLLEFGAVGPVREPLPLLVGQFERPSSVSQSQCQQTQQGTGEDGRPPSERSEPYCRTTVTLSVTS